MKKTALRIAALTGAVLSLASSAAGQVHFFPGGAAAAGGGAAGGYPGVEPLVVLPYANGGGGSNSAIQAPNAPGAPFVGGGQGQAGQVPVGPNVIEQREDLADQQSPSMNVTDPDDSVLAQGPMDDPQDASGFEGLQAIDNEDSSY